MTLFVFVLGISISRIINARRCTLPTAARTRPCCDSVAAGRPNLHVEEAQNGTLGQAHENSNDFGPTRGQTSTTTYVRDHDDCSQNALDAKATFALFRNTRSEITGQVRSVEFCE